MSNKIFKVKVKLSSFICSKPVHRNSDFWPVAANSAEEIDIELCNKPENLHKFIPSFILGKSRDAYKVVKILEIHGPIGNN